MNDEELYYWCIYVDTMNDDGWERQFPTEDEN